MSEEVPLVSRRYPRYLKAFWRYLVVRHLKKTPKSILNIWKPLILKHTVHQTAHRALFFIICIFLKYSWTSNSALAFILRALRTVIPSVHGVVRVTLYLVNGQMMLIFAGWLNRNEDRGRGHIEVNIWMVDHLTKHALTNAQIWYSTLERKNAWNHLPYQSIDT